MNPSVKRNLLAGRFKYSSALVFTGEYRIVPAKEETASGKIRGRARGR